MLNKLLKYDLKYIFKTQIYIFGTTIICLIIAKIFQSTVHDFFIYYSIHLSFLMFTYALMFVLIINNFIRLWSRFKNTIYGDESYLIHTLPVTKNQIFLSKTLTSIITLTTSTIFVFIADLIVRDFKLRGVYTYVSTGLNIFINQYLNSFPTQITIYFIILLVLITLSMIGYFSLIFGHKAKRNKLVLSIIIGIVLFILTLSLSFVFYAIIGIFNYGISNFLWNSTLTNATKKTLFIITVIFYIMTSSVYYWFSLRKLEKGINVE